MNKTGILNIDEGVSYPNGFSISDNRIEDYLQRHISPESYVVWRQLLRFWGSSKTRAYPSLSTLSERTGLSERIIRSCNEELVKKKFLSKTSGSTDNSNNYYYIPIEKILVEYYGTTDPVAQQKADVEDRKQRLIKAKRPLDQLTDKERVFVEMLLANFMALYEEKMNHLYEVEPSDIRALIENTNRIMDQGDRVYDLIEIFFKTKNEYIQRSSYNLFLFFRPKIQKALIAEYHKSDKGRWESQAEKIWQEVRPKIEKLYNEQHWPYIMSDLNPIEKWVKKNVNFSGASKDRDEFVKNLLIRTIKEHIESLEAKNIQEHTSS